METSYLKLVSGSRISNYLGLQMVEGYNYSYPKTAESDYAYIDIPIQKIFLTSSREEINHGYKLKKNVWITIEPACSVNPRGRGHRFEVHPNTQFRDIGITDGSFYLEPGSGASIPRFQLIVKADLDLDLTKFEYSVRIYMRQ